MITETDRLTALEMRSAEQERTVEELSAQLTQQWAAIERLEKALAAMRDRLAEVEDGTRSETPVTRPPHW